MPDLTRRSPTRTTRLSDVKPCLTSSGQLFQRGTSTQSITSSLNHKPVLKAGANFRKYKVKRNCWPEVRGCAMNLVEHPHGGGNHQHVDHASVVAPCLLPHKQTSRSTPFLSSLIPLSLVVESTVRGVEGVGRANTGAPVRDRWN